MKLEYNIEFPCGLKFHIKARALNIDIGEINIDACPIHGKKCKQNKETNKNGV